jgi:hypothetical protein
MATTLHDVARGLRRQAGALRVAPKETAAVTAPVLAAGVHAVFGHAPPLADLAQSTQEERATLGYAANEPLVRSHELEESWVPGVSEGREGPISAVGSSNPMASWHEHGFYNHRAQRFVPPRPAGWEGFTAAQVMARAIWKNTIGRISKLR